MTPQEIERRIRRGREVITKAKGQGQDVKEWEEHLRRLEAVRDRLGAPQPHLHNFISIYSREDVKNPLLPLAPFEGALARFSGRVMMVRVYSKTLGREVWVCSNPQAGGSRPDSHASGYWLVDVLLPIDPDAVREALEVMERADRAKEVSRC